MCIVCNCDVLNAVSGQLRVAAVHVLCTSCQVLLHMPLRWNINAIYGFV